VTLGIACVSTGQIIFALINKFFPLLSNYEYPELKAGISGMIVSFPIFYFIVSRIYKGMQLKEFDIDSGARKWLTYLIIFISSVVMIGSLIGLLNNFLDGEATLNFILKALTVLGISSIVFSFYFNDIKKKEVDTNMNRIYFFSTLIIAIIVFVSSFFIVESPVEARNRKIDEKIVSNLQSVTSAVNQYYSENKRLPQDFNEIKTQEYSFVDSNSFIEESTGKYYEYKIVDDKKYEICATFSSSNLDNGQKDYYSMYWKHDKGYQCLTRRVDDNMKY
jgi:heme/copper-type cytochrome/quinol oxidase subunit 4